MMMSTPVPAAELIDILSERGYVPVDDVDHDDVLWADLHGDDGYPAVRVVVNDQIEIYVFAPNMVMDWSARFDAGTPLPVVEALLDAASVNA